MLLFSSDKNVTPLMCRSKVSSRPRWPTCKHWLLLPSKGRLRQRTGPLLQTHPPKVCSPADTKTPTLPSASPSPPLVTMELHGQIRSWWVIIKVCAEAVPTGTLICTQSSCTIAVLCVMHPRCKLVDWLLVPVGTICAVKKGSDHVCLWSPVSTDQLGCHPLSQHHT